MLKRRVAYHSVRHRLVIASWVLLLLFTAAVGLSAGNEMYRLPIASAAAIMVTVFGTFVPGDLRTFTLLTVGVAAAVLLDAIALRRAKAH